MRLLVTRHGETVWNHENKVLGRTDIPLNEKGLEQARVLAETLKQYNIDCIFSSPLKRAMQTAEAVRIKQGEGCSLIAELQLIEQDYGSFEGADRYSEAYQQEKRRYFSRYSGGESFLDVAARVYPFLEKLAALKAESCLIVSHNGICRMINSYFNEMNNEEFVSFSLNNCEVMEFNI